MKYIKNFKDDDGNDLDPFEEIFKYFLFRANETGVLSDDPNYFEKVMSGEGIENVIVMLISIFSKGDVEIYETIDECYKNHDLEESINEYLDDLGKILGIPRVGATSAVVGLTFTIDTPLTEAQVLDEGIVVSTADGIEYETIEPLVFKANETSFECAAKAKIAGLQSRVNPNTLTILGTDIESIIKTPCHVNNKYGSTGGSLEQNDDDYRKYLLDYEKLYVRSSAYLYKYFLDSFDGIRSYNLIPCWNGTGTLKIIVDVNENSFKWIKQELENQIKEKISFVDDDVIVEQAHVNVIDLDINIKMDVDYLVNKDVVVAESQEVIKTYVNGGVIDGEEIKGLGIGDDLILYQLGIFLNENVDEIYDVSFSDPQKNIICDDYSIIRAGDLFVNIVDGDV